jgi:hypothetical protein
LVVWIHHMPGTASGCWHPLGFTSRVAVTGTSSSC